MIWSDTWPADLARRLRASRANRSLRQTAREAGVDASRLCLIEAGSRRPTIAELRAFAIYLQVSPEDLLGIGRCRVCRAVVDAKHVERHCEHAWTPSAVRHVSAALDDDADSILWTLASHDEIGTVELVATAGVDALDHHLASISRESQARGLPPPFRVEQYRIEVDPTFATAARSARCAIMEA